MVDSLDIKHTGTPAETNLSDSEKKALANLQALGRDLVTQFFVCLKTASLYDATNENFKNQLSKFHDLIQVAHSENLEISITSVDGYLFFNEIRLKINLDGYLAAKYIQNQFEMLKISGLLINNGIKLEELSTVIQQFISQSVKNPNAQFLNEYLQSENIESIQFIPSLTLTSKEENEVFGDERLSAKKTFFKAVSVVSDVFNSYSQDHQVNIIKAKRVVHSLVDQIIKSEAILLELTALKNYDQYTYMHCVNVSIFSIALGLRLGLNKNQLAELSFAALFHDFGKTKIPIDLLNKPDGLSSSDWSLLQDHPVYGVKELAQAFSMDRHTARAMLVSFEHHKNLDGTGYPYVNRTKPVNLYSRIVAICDYFDALTSGRTYRKNAVPIDEVILQMMKQSNVKFDAHLLKILINIIGIYPVGSLLLLDSGELALVTQTNPEDLFRPEVKIIADKNGKKARSVRAQLSSYNPESGKYFRNVLHIVDPDKYNIDISEYILED